MNYPAINLSEKLALFSEHWSPRVIAELNDYQVKLAKLKGDFVWHKHDETDELFICIDGDLTIEFRDGSVELTAGELFVVPRGVEHRPHARNECHVLLIEPRGVTNTGDAVDSDLTTAGNAWL